MIRLRRFTLLLTLAALAAATVAATPAEAAKRKVPFGFFSMVVPPELSSARSETVLDQQYALMASSGVESVRVTQAWDQLEPSKGRYTFEQFDRNVKAAATHGLEVLFNITATPRWASSRPRSRDWFRAAPKDPTAYGALMSVLVARYGPGGSFWAANPTVQPFPIRRWQVWNEENAPWHWSTRPWQRGYTQLLKSAYQAIKAVDRQATVVAGSFVAAPNYSQWEAATDLYKAGGKRWFDEIAVHPFTNNKQSVSGTIDQMLEIVKRVRQRTRRAGDGRVPISITELSWPASVGKIPKKALLGLETTTKGQRLRMKAGYKRLVRNRRKLKITRAYWYTWATQYDRQSPDSVMSFRYAGLTRVRNGVFSPMPILRTFTQTARKYQGCRKSTDARRCR